MTFSKVSTCSFSRVSLPTILDLVFFLQRIFYLDPLLLSPIYQLKSTTKSFVKLALLANYTEELKLISAADIIFMLFVNTPIGQFGKSHKHYIFLVLLFIVSDSLNQLTFLQDTILGDLPFLYQLYTVA